MYHYVIVGCNPAVLISNRIAMRLCNRMAVW